MKNLCTILVACTLVASLAACNAPAIVAPDSPNFDGGHTFGGGNYLASTDTTTSSADDAERGGPFTVGSGN